MITKITKIVFFFFLVFTIEYSAQEFENGEIGISLNSYGRVRIHAPAIGANIQIDRFSFLAGVARDQVYDYKNDSETLDSSRTIESPTLSDYEMYVKTDNAYSELPPAFQSAVTVYGWNSGGYALVKYEFTNKEADNLETTFGFEILPQIDGVYGFETIKYVSSKKFVQLQVGQLSTKVGFKILNEPLTTLTAIDWFTEYELGDTLLWDWLTTGVIANAFNSGSDGAVGTMGIAPKTWSIDNNVELWVAIFVGNSDNALTSNLTKAEEKYSIITSVSNDDLEIPTDFRLNQNYPNPFNPNTTIKFSIPKSTGVNLNVYNLVGEKVAELVNEDLAAGNYSINFNSTNLSSGIYFYKIITSDFIESKKMILLK